MATVPRLTLTHGQVAWAICSGQRPDKVTVDRLRYLRQLGIPFTEEEVGVGRGNRLTYGFDHLIECAIALWSIRRGTKPRAAAEFLIAERKPLRKLFREHFRAMPEAALTAEWIASKGRIKPTLADELFVSLHGHPAVSDTVDTMTLDEVITFQASFGDQVQRHGNEVHPLVPLNRVMLEAVALAQLAPVTPPGRTARKKEGEPTL